MKTPLAQRGVLNIYGSGWRGKVLRGMLVFLVVSLIVLAELSRMLR